MRQPVSRWFFYRNGVPHGSTVAGKRELKHVGSPPKVCQINRHTGARTLIGQNRLFQIRRCVK